MGRGKDVIIPRLVSRTGHCRGKTWKGMNEEKVASE